jgi:hypothetical protein
MTLRTVCKLVRPHNVLPLVLIFTVLAMGACSDDEGGGVGSGDPFQLGDDLELVATPSQVNFGSVSVGDQSVQDVTLQHIGVTGVVRLLDVELEASSGEITMTQPLVSELSPGASTVFSVTYAPTDNQNDSGVVRITTNIPDTGGGTKVLEIPIVILAPYGELAAIPSELNFGEVASGTTQTQALKIRNIGSIPVTLTEIVVENGGSQDFAVISVPEMGSSYGTNDEFNVGLAYTPVGGGDDSAQLKIAYESEGESYELLVLLRGLEMSALLKVFPNPMDFGNKVPDNTYELPLGIANQGGLPLTITAMDVLETTPSSTTIKVVDFPANGLTLSSANGNDATVTISFTPTNDMPVSTSPIAGLRILSNDPAGNGETIIPIFGRPMAPAIQVNPPELVDFGFVAQNLTTNRKVNIYNGGSADLTVTKIWIQDGAGATVGEFTFKDPEGWGPTQGAPQPATIASKEFHEFKVSFTNKGASTGTAWAKLHVESNDKSGDWVVDLKAQRAGAPTCKVQLVPDQVDYGIVPRGYSKTLKFQLVNVGSGKCGFHSAFVNDCAGWGGFFGTSCDDPSTTIQIDGTSDYYKVTEKPFSAANNLEPGMSYPISVTFTPPETAPLFGDEMTDYAGLLAVRVSHTYTADGSTELLLFPEPTGGDWPPNLHAKSGMAELAVFPQELDFGLVTIGCHSQTLTVWAYNIGTAPLSLTDWELVGCGPEFTLKSEPVLPLNGELVMNPEDGVEYQVVYVPQDQTEDSCSLAIYTNAADTPAAVVPLNGAGTLETEETDTWIQTSGQDVDVLFVVDNSGSMGEEQSNLSSNFQTFINQASAWNNDYHVGVVTTDLEGDSGLLQGDPRYVVNTDWQTFSSNVKVGTNGSGTEQGLAAAQAALSLPLVANSTLVCASDAECSAPDACVDGFCGGPNRGFLRKEAALEIVFVSDEDDQSAADLNFYENFFKNLKGFFNANMMHVHAIVGPQGGCTSASGDAVAGNRYIDLANSTGGNVISICEANFSQGLSSIGEIAFGLKVQFFLSRVPVPASIEVKVNGAPCVASSGGTTNWTYDEPSNAVVFNEDGGCMPQPGQEVWVHYDTLCFTD